MQNLTILAKLEELDAYTHRVLLQFPKYERHVLCATIRQTLANLIKLTIRCAKKYYKKNSLQDIDVELEYLRSLVRKAYILKYINTHKYEVWSKHINEVGKMLGGWIKSVSK